MAERARFHTPKLLVATNSLEIAFSSLDEFKNSKVAFSAEFGGVIFPDRNDLSEVSEVLLIVSSALGSQAEYEPRYVGLFSRLASRILVNRSRKWSLPTLARSTSKILPVVRAVSMLSWRAVSTMVARSETSDSSAVTDVFSSRLETSVETKFFVLLVHCCPAKG